MTNEEAARRIEQTKIALAQARSGQVEWPKTLIRVNDAILDLLAEVLKRLPETSTPKPLETRPLVTDDDFEIVQHG